MVVLRNRWLLEIYILSIHVSSIRHMSQTASDGNQSSDPQGQGTTLL
jgi:hypothetical protein